MRKLLEVIATSIEDAIEAEAGGADRIELVRELGVGGLTPAFDLTSAVLQAIHIPVRVMLRENPTMSAGDEGEICRLTEAARRFAQLPLDGMVAGFLQDGVVDELALRAVLEGAPQSRFTFHRAFDEVSEPLAAIEQLKALRRIDRVLTVGGEGDWPERKARLIEWQRAASPEITLLIGAGLSNEVFSELACLPDFAEIHVGRAARLENAIDRPVAAEAVQKMRHLLA